VDERNTSGFGKEGVAPIVAAFTYAGAHAPQKKPFTQAIAYSVDRGRTMVKFEGNPVIENVTGGLFDIELVMEPRNCSRVGLRLHGYEIECTADAIRCLGQVAPLVVENGAIMLRVLVDRTSIEVFAGHGEVAMSTCFLPKKLATDLSLFASDGEARIVGAKGRTLKSAWGV
jgi:sucrose-6-phosphate hydrolase SacC (GH32 family)